MTQEPSAKPPPHTSAQAAPEHDPARLQLIAPGTVKVHLCHICAKLGITTRAELAAQAAAQDLAAR